LATTFHLAGATFSSVKRFRGGLMMNFRPFFSSFAAVALVIASVSAADAAACGGSFDAWLNEFKTEAAAKGIAQSAIAAGLSGVTPDQGVLSRDRGQRVFQQSFEEFSTRMIPPRLGPGSNKLKQYGSALSRIEQQYGVPGEVLVAIWGLETDYGVNTGKFPTIRSLATLAYDCRRAELFRAELMDALRIVERGDLSPSEMRGAWAGEIGQTSSCRRPGSSLPWISTVTAAATCSAARRTCWPRPRITSPATAGSAARILSPAAPISP